ncbi:MAG: insulinase family protein, partial [Verrucomicrobiota bacterium]|nr:insulinase family protein [Verrucomicrobiota bacterium]
IEDLKALSTEKVRAHYRALIRSSNLVLSVTGDYKREQLLEVLEPLLDARLSSEPFHGEETDITKKIQAHTAHEVMDREQSVVLQAYPDVGIRDEDFIVAEMLNELFSGMSSRLFERVREDQGMAYYVGSTRVIGIFTGMFVFYAGTHPSQSAAVLSEIEIEIARVSAGKVTQEELSRCRTRLKASRRMGKQTLGARAMHAAIQVTYGLPIEDDSQYAAKLDQVDISALARFAKLYFTEDQKVQLTVGPDQK